MEQRWVKMLNSSLYLVLECLGYTVLGYGKGFLIVDQEGFKLLRKCIPKDSIILEVNKDKVDYVMLKYNSQNEEIILKNLVNLEDIYDLIVQSVDSKVIYNEEKDCIIIPNRKTKKKIERIVNNDIVQIVYLKDSLIWEMRVKNKNYIDVFYELNIYINVNKEIKELLILLICVYLIGFIVKVIIF